MYVRPNPWVIEEDQGAAVITFGHSSGGMESARPLGLKVWIYSLPGALVRVLDDPVEAPLNSHHAYWDGKNEDGELVAAGVYFLVVDNGRRQTTGKIAIVR